MKTLIPHLTALITVAIWGGTFVSTKLLLMAGLTAAQIFVLRFIIAYILLMAMSLMGSGNRQWFCRTWRDELLMAALGITGGSLYFMAENTELNYTTTNTSLIVCSCPLAAAILIGMVYRSQRMNRQQLTGALMAVAGVAAVILNGHFVLHLSPLGDALALVACLCWAAYSLLMIPANRNYSALFITRKVFFYGLLTILPYFIVHPTMPTMPLLLRPDVAANLLFLSCVASLGCYLAWTWVMDRLGAVVATNYVYLNPLFTIVFAWLILSERITPWFIVGTALIVTGMYLADRKKKE